MVRMGRAGVRSGTGSGGERCLIPHSPFPTPHSPYPRPMTDISLWIERHAGFFPGRTAVRFQGQTVSYADLAHGIERAAAMLHGELGLRRGDRIAWLGLNHPDMLGLLL